MKTRSSLVAVALSLTGAAYCLGATKTAAPAASPAAAKNAKATAPKKEAAKMAAPMSPHMGTWTLNEAKSKIPAGMNKNTTVVYTEMKDKMKVAVDGAEKGGKPTHGVRAGT